MATKPTNFSDVNFSLKEVIYIIGVVGMACGLYFGIVARQDIHEERLDQHDAIIAKSEKEKNEYQQRFLDMQKDFQKQNAELMELLEKIADEKDNTVRSSRR